MLRLFPRPLVRALGASAIAAAAAVPLAMPAPAHAWWVRGGWGWRGGVVVGVAPPPVYVAPSVVYAPPPPVAYAPPPAPYYYPPPRRVWVPGHWRNGYWVPAHWA